MAFEIIPAESSDAPQMAEVFQAAFTGDFNCRMFPPTPDVHAWVTENIFTSRSGAEQDEAFFKVTDPETDKVVAVAKWILPKSADRSADAKETVTWPASSDKDLCNSVFGQMEAHHHRLMGSRPHYYLDILGVHPSYQGRKLAGKLIKWGLDLADEQGIEVFLSATPEGKPLYLKSGFEVRDSFSPAPGREQFSMVRPSKK